MLWILAAIFSLGGVSRLVECCHPNSKELHVCLNIYLEKDFPFIETLIEAKGSRKGRILLEDKDLSDICRHGTTLHDCYRNITSECNSYWQVDRFSRLMHLLQETLSYLCSDNLDPLKDIFMNVDCMKRYATDIISGCSSETGFSWITTWKEILRMQVSPADRCPSMDAYRTCLVGRLQTVICGKEASRVYGDLMDVWLESWCNKNSNKSSAEYLYQPLTLRQKIVRVDIT